MSFSNKPEFDEEMKDRLTMPETVISQDLPDYSALEVDSVAALVSGDLPDLTIPSSESAALKPEAMPKEPKDEVRRSLNLGFVRGYWIAVTCGCFFAAGLLYFCIFYPALCWYLSIFIFATLLLVGWAYEHIRWSKKAAAAVSCGIYSWADVTILRELEVIDEQTNLHVLINKTLLLPVSEIDNGFDQHLLIEIIQRPAARRKVFYLPDSDLPVVIATETNYLLLGRYGGSFVVRHAVPLALILLGVQFLFYWFMGDLFNFFHFS